MKQIFFKGLYDAILKTVQTEGTSKVISTLSPINQQELQKDLDNALSTLLDLASQEEQDPGLLLKIQGLLKDQEESSNKILVNGVPFKKERLKDS